VLEHLCAEHQVEAGVFDRELFSLSAEICDRVVDRIDPDVARRDAREVWVVGLAAATDVEDAKWCPGCEFGSLSMKPQSQRMADCPGW